MRETRLVYYAHHHGSGHLRDARRFAAAVDAEVTIVGPSGADVVLPPDVDPDHPHRQHPDSPLHWTPTTAAVRRRFAALHDVLTSVDPDLVLVDVSVEATLFVHLAGYPVLVRRLPGERSDRAHRLGYDVARGLFAYYPRALEEPGFPYADRTTWLGAPQGGPPTRACPVPGRVVVLTGAGGAGVSPQALEAAAAATPTHEWHVLGSEARPSDRSNLVLHGWVDDVPGWLASADVVVCGAGANTLIDVAHAQRPCVVVPEPRPHDEQSAFAGRLQEAAGIRVAQWDDDWADVLRAPSAPRALADALLVPAAEFRHRANRLVADALDGGAAQ